MSENYICFMCKNGNCCVIKSEMLETRNLLIIGGHAFKYNSIQKQIVKYIKINDISMSHVDSASEGHELSSAIFHIGDSPSSGHYISVINTRK